MSPQTEQTGPVEWVAEANRVAHGIRRRVLAHTLERNGGYLSQGCSSAELLATLYTRILRLGPSEGPMTPPPFSGTPGAGGSAPLNGGVYNGPRAPELDRFVFSPVHYSLALYATLIEVGRLSPGALDYFDRDGSTVEMIGAEHSPGIELTAGSLAQALSQAGGIALARKLKNETGRVWVMMTDGELQEGQTWEAFAAAAFHRLDNLGVLFDVNGQQCDGPMDTVMEVEPAAERLRAFGAHVLEVDGHDVLALAAAAAYRVPGKPLAVLALTDPCQGLEIMRARAPKFHYVRFKSEEERHSYEEALAEMGEEP
jgi:transketolase